MAASWPNSPARSELTIPLPSRPAARPCRAKKLGIFSTTPEQLRAVVHGLRRLLGDHRSVEPESVRVRFLRLGSSSLDVDVSAYLYARDWNHFLEAQEELLFAVTELVAKAGTEIAFPSRTMCLANAPLAGTARDSAVST